MILMKKTTGATPIDDNQVFHIDADIYAPCAMGATLNPTSIDMLKCSIVAGAANNQLLEENRDALSLQKKGILFAPDFLINAGGLINVYSELEGYNEKRAYMHTEKIYTATLEVLKYAYENNITTYQAAIQRANKRIETVGKIKKYR